MQRNIIMAGHINTTKIFNQLKLRRMKKSTETLLRSGLLHQRELERLCDMPRGTLNYWLNGTRPLNAKYEPALEVVAEKIGVLLKGKISVQHLKNILYDPRINTRSVCRAAKVKHSTIIYWLSGFYIYSHRPETTKKLIEALKNFTQHKNT